MPPSQEQTIKDELAAIAKKREERAKAAELRELQGQLKKERREEEEVVLEERLKDEMPDRELGVHYDFLRFGDHLVAFGHNKAAHELFVRKTPDKGHHPAPEVKNFATRCLLEVDGVKDLGPRAEAFDRIVEEFPGAPAAIANVLLELAKGGVAVRQGK